jgi:DNA-binding transcriptional regulator YhcF (GntR family)
MIISIDFNSDEAIYIQLINSIIMEIATNRLREGDALPSVRQLADEIGINMHTVNKAYSVLKQQGYIKLDRRKGAVIAVDLDKVNAMNDLTDDIRVVLAKALCRNLSPQEVHSIVDEVMAEFLPHES